MVAFNNMTGLCGIIVLGMSNIEKDLRICLIALKMVSKNSSE